VKRIETTLFSGTRRAPESFTKDDTRAECELVPCNAGLKNQIEPGCSIRRVAAIGCL